MAVVQTRDLTKVFKEGQLGAVNSVNFETREGEFLVFLGPSGSGKTTLLRMIAGLEAPTSGDILIGGRVVNDLSPRELSGGERQRVALARAIVREPAVFLLDEPLSNLDAKLRASAREELERFHRRVGTTTIYVTHDQVEAMAMGDRVMVLNKGVVCQLGTPTDVYDHPADTFVATFLGSPPMNLAEIGDVIVGFRPEHFRPASTVTGDSVPFRFKVENIEYLGSEWIVSGTPVGGKLDAKKVFSRLSSAQNLRLGGTYDFAVPQHQLKFFDRSSEKRAEPRAVSWQKTE